MVAPAGAVGARPPESRSGKLSLPAFAVQALQRGGSALDYTSDMIFQKVQTRGFKAWSSNMMLRIEAKKWSEVSAV